MIWFDRLIKPSPTNDRPELREQLVNDLAVAVTVLFAFLLALGVRNQVDFASQVVLLNAGAANGGALRVAYPDRWAVREQSAGGFTALQLGSPSLYETQITVSSRPLGEAENLETARFERSLKLAAGLDTYRELTAETLTLLNGTPALVTTYGFVVDPAQESGAAELPVVVKGQDILFVAGDFLYSVTLRADALAWDASTHAFAVVTASLRLQPVTELWADPARSRNFDGAVQTEGGN
jgi:hypothetical protein